MKVRTGARGGPGSAGFESASASDAAFAASPVAEVVSPSGWKATIWAGTKLTCATSCVGHRGGAIPCDPGAVSERVRERTAQRGEDVLDGVVLVDVEVAACEQLEIEAAVERPQREQVIEEPDPGRDERAPVAVEVEHDPERGLGARPRDDRRPAGRRADARTEGFEQDVVLGRPPERDPNPVGEDPDDQPGRFEALAERLPRAHPDEVAVRLGAVVAGGGEGFADALALGDGRLDVEARLAQCSGCDPGGRSRDARRRPAPVELGSGLRCGDRIANTQRGEPEGFRERSQHDHVRQLGDERDRGDAGELPVGLVDHDRRLRVSSRERRDLVRIAQLAGRVVGIADPDQVGAVRLGDDLRALQLRRDSEEAVGRREDRRAAARGEKRRRTEGDQLVGARTGNDLVSPGPAVGRGRLTQLAEGAVRVLVQPREARRERNLRHARERRRVLVEAKHLLWSQTVPGRDLGRRRRPLVGPVVLRQRVRAQRSSSAAAWRGSPSIRASGSAISRARSSEVARTNWTGFRKLSSPSPPAPFASPLVGSTCVAPAA